MITLTIPEQKLAKYVSTKRYLTCRAWGLPISKVGPQSLKDTDLEGFASELAAARLLNVYPDLDLNVQAEDLITAQGYSVDVKVTKYPHGKLISKITKTEKPCDFYMLMIGTFPSYECCGVASRSSLLCPTTLKDFGYGPTHALDQEQLMSFKLFNNKYN